VSGYEFDGSICADTDECSDASKNNCHANADCQNLDGGFLCTCQDGYVGDGVTCRLSQKASMEQPGEPVGGLAMPSRNPNPDGTDISIYSKLAPGECSVMGFEWENQEKLLKTMKWSKEPELYSNMATQLLTEFSRLGKAALGRSVQQCDMEKAGIVPCKLLYFPHSEPRCQLIQRLNKVYQDIALFCNHDWQRVFGGKMATLLSNNQSFKGGACPPVKYL